MLENLILLGFIGAAIALIFAFIQRGIVMKHSEGNDKMVEIAQAIRDGANAYLKHQYMTVGKLPDPTCCRFWHTVPSDA